MIAIIHRDRYLEALIEPPKFRLRGILVVELVSAKSGLLKRRLEFDNLITNAALDYVGVGTGVIGKSFSTELLFAAGCGTGSNTPAVTDTALQAEITPISTNRTTSVGGGADAELYNGTPEYYEFQHVREFSTSQANGNLTEIGFFSTTTGATMFMRQLFKDSGGTPTTIVKTSADILRVTYKLRIYPPAGDSTGTIVISGTTYTWTLRPANTNVSRAWGPGDGTFYGLLTGLGGNWGLTGQLAYACETDVLGARTSEPSGTQTLSNSDSVGGYTTGNYYRDVTTTWTTAVANYATGIGSIAFWRTQGARYPFQESFSPKFAKDNTKQLTLIHRLAWARYP